MQNSTPRNAFSGGSRSVSVVQAISYRVTRMRKIPKFVLSNVLGTIVDTLVLWSLSHYMFVGYVEQYLLAPLISFECAVLVNFLCSWHFVWNDRVRKGALYRFWRKYLYYNLSVTGTFLVKMGFLLLLKRFFGWSVVVCNLVALCISGTINFVMGEWVIFRRNDGKG